MASSSLPASFNSSALASSLPRPSSAHPHPSQDDIKNELQDHIRNLHSQDQNVVAKAAAAIVMLATVSSAENYLSPAGKQLSLLLVTSESIFVQRNACAALSAIMNSSFQNYKTIVQLPSLMERLLLCLEDKNNDKGLQINVVSAISIMAQHSEGLKIIQAAEADTKLISLLDSNDDTKLEEEITDALCALAVHEEMRRYLVTKGIIPKFVRKLKADSTEICVRILLGLGMLCGSSQEAQEQLAETDGAISMLLSLMKSSDPDIRAITHDLFASLSSSSYVKQKIEHFLRETTH